MSDENASPRLANSSTRPGNWWTLKGDVIRYAIGKHAGNRVSFVANDIEAKLEALKESRGTEGKAVTVTETIANPAPLGLAAFGLTTLLLNVVNAKIINASDIGMVLPVGLFTAVCSIAGRHVEFKKNNTFGATAFLIRRLLAGLP
jgi:hypothetical protein